MLTRTLLICLVVFAQLPLFAALPPAAREVFRSTQLAEVRIQSADPGHALFQISDLCFASKSRTGNLDFVLVADIDEKTPPFTFSGKEVRLPDLIRLFCDKYGWSLIYTERAVVIGTKVGLDRFASVYKKKRWPLEKNLILPKIILLSATLNETARFLTKKADELDREGQWEIQAAGDTEATVNLCTQNIPMGELIQLVAAAVGRDPEDALRTTRVMSAGENAGPDAATPALGEVTVLKCAYWRAFDEDIEIEIRRQEDGRLLLNCRVLPIRGSPAVNKGVANKVIAPEQLAPVLEFINSTAMRGAFAGQARDDRPDGSAVDLEVEQREFGVRFFSQDVFGREPAVKDLGMRRAVEALVQDGRPPIQGRQVVLNAARFGDASPRGFNPPSRQAGSVLGWTRNGRAGKQEVASSTDLPGANHSCPCLHAIYSFSSPARLLRCRCPRRRLRRHP